ncbi:MAG: VOC family protein [Pseudomonadota bacterium]
MPLTKLDHFLVFTNDLETTKDFYCDVLGMEVGDRPAFNFPGYWIYVDGRAVVHLATKSAELEQYLGDRDDSGGTGPIDHIAFTGEAINDFKNRFDQLEIPFHEREVPGFDLTQLFVDDPNGVKIELNFFHPA